MVSRLLIIFLFIFLSACESSTDSDLAEELGTDKSGPIDQVDQDKGLFGQNIAYDEYRLPSEGVYSSFGGIDFKFDQNGFLHAVYALKYLDVPEGGYRYALHYVHNKTGNFSRRVLRKDQSIFYRTGYSYGEKNFMKIDFDESGDVVIAYLARNNDLVVIREGESFVPRTLASHVGSFDFLYDRASSEMHLGYFSSSTYSDKSFHHRVYKNWAQLSSRSYGSGLAPDAYRNHVEMKLHNGQLYSFFKVYNQANNTGQFLMAANGNLYSLSNGVVSTGVFNVYEKDGYFNTCYKDVVNKRYRLKIRLSNMSGTSTYASYKQDRSSPYHCAVSEDYHFPHLKYNNLSFYGSSYFDFFNFSNWATDRHYVSQIKDYYNIKQYAGSLWFAGIASNNGTPIILRKR